MALIDTPTPTLDIHKSARPYIADTFFDGSQYASYLYDRGVTEEQLAGLALTITDEGISPLAIANFGRDGGNSLIRFSARHMSRDITKQNTILFHETEHFIWEEKHPHTHKTKATLIIGSLAIGSIGTASLMGHATFNATEGLPMVVRGAASLVSGVASGAAGGVSSVLTANGLYQEISPNEINARKAAKREVKRNPELLRIAFK